MDDKGKQRPFNDSGGSQGRLKGVLIPCGREAGDPEVQEEGSQQSNASAHLWLTDEIIMAAPLRITDMTSGLLGGEDGRVYIYNGKHTTLGDMTGKCKSWLTPCPEEKVKALCRFHSMREAQRWLGVPCLVTCRAVLSSCPGAYSCAGCLWSWSPAGLVLVHSWP